MCKCAATSAMAVQLDPNSKDDLKTQFVTREGTYRLMTLSEYSRPNRVGYQTNQSNPQVRVSIVTLPQPLPSLQSPGQLATGGNGTNTTPATNIVGQSIFPTSNSSGTTNPLLTNHLTSPTLGNGNNTGGGNSIATNLPGSNQFDALGQPQSVGGDRICFNFGKELYVYSYRGVKKQSSDLCKPIDKKLYKGTNPSCHDFNEAMAISDGAPLLVGFTTGQIQLLHPSKREPGRIYNEERLIDKTKVTCLKWLPKSPNLFLASHASGHLYLYNEELLCSPIAPTYQNFKVSDGYTILTCKSKSSRNPLYKWTFGTENCCINEFCFSPCGSMLAIVSQDGFLRVFHYDTMELLGVARSYFGGFLCVCWSPDGKYIVVGGEDDLVTVWSLHERRVVARGQGHRSWVSVVAFDPYTSYSQWDGPDFSDDENPMSDGYMCGNSFNSDSQFTNDVDCESNPINSSSNNKRSSIRNSLATEKLGTSYRLGSVSQDTQICLWDITEDVLRQSYEIRQRLSSHDPQNVTTIMSNGEVSSGIGSNIDYTAKDNLNVSGKSSNSKPGPGSNNKFTANCTSESTSGSSILSYDQMARSSSNENSKHSIISSNKINSNISSNLTNIKNSSNVMKSDASTQLTDSGGGSKSTSSGGSNKSSDSGMTTFNALTQRLSNFGLGNDKKSSDSNAGSGGTYKKGFLFSKNTNSGPTTNTNHNNNSDHQTQSSSTIGNVNDHPSSITLLKNSKSSNTSVVSSYDPMKLIGTAACPRFDECPLLEPLVCKKIAHERLTALIFREDCFLTACQDGFIYTWARPGYWNIQQHNTIANSPNATAGGTVV